jgi:hypothetical protein
MVLIQWSKLIFLIVNLFNRECMEKVKTLLRKLQQQITEGDSAELLLTTVQMMQLELAYLRDKQAIDLKESESASAPINLAPPVIRKPLASATYAIPDIEKKIIGILQIDEEELAAELDEIKRNASLMQQISGQSKPNLVIESEQSDIPTFSQQLFQQNSLQEVPAAASTEKETPSVNDRLKETKVEISDTLSAGPIKDLKKAIGINDRFLYINDLFEGDESAFDRSVKIINGFSIWPEAEYWIRRELKKKLGWKEDSESVQQFDQLVRRRFS